jgi:glycosyltransferase involved in cell wall biosynthesis
MTAPRVLFLIDEVEGLAAGGTERQLFQTIQALSRSEFQVELAVLRGSFSSESAGCPVHNLNFPRKLASLDGFRAVFRLWKWLRSRRFEIVQTFFTDANLIGPIAAKLAGVPTVVGGRRNLNHWMSPGFARFQAISNMFVDVLLANSEMVKQAVCRTENVRPSKVQVIYNAIDLERFKRNLQTRAELRQEFGFADDHVVIGNVANLRAIKGVPDFLEAAALVIRTDPNCRFIQVGEGDLRRSIEARIVELGLQNTFLLLGRRNDVPDLLSAFDIGVLTSHAEGFSNSVLEYMAAELPVVVTDVGGNREAIGETAAVVAAGDVGAIASALQRLASDAQLRKTMGASGCKRVKELFADDSIREAWLNFYRTLLKSKSRTLP